MNLGTRDGSYLKEIEDKTKDIDVQVVFNNAGFMLTGFFDRETHRTLMTNHECNCTKPLNANHARVREENVGEKIKRASCLPPQRRRVNRRRFQLCMGRRNPTFPFAANVASEVKSRGITRRSCT